MIAFSRYLYQGFSLQWSGFPGNPDPRSLYGSDTARLLCLSQTNPRECTKYSIRIANCQSCVIIHTTEYTYSPNNSRSFCTILLHLYTCSAFTGVLLERLITLRHRARNYSSRQLIEYLLYRKSCK